MVPNESNPYSSEGCVSIRVEKRHGSELIAFSVIALTRLNPRGKAAWLRTRRALLEEPNIVSIRVEKRHGSELIILMRRWGGQVSIRVEKRHGSEPI